jgi:hypothetical protein
MMQTTMLVQAMMQEMGDGGVYDIASHSNNEFQKEWPWACLDITCESPSFFRGHLISFQLVPKYIR